MTVYMCFLETLVIACTVSDILAQIDLKGLNWIFLTLKMTFRVIAHLSYFRTGFVSHQRRYMIQDIFAALRYYWIISIIIAKWTKCDISDLENDLWNNSIKSRPWQLINIIPKKLYAKNKETLSDRFLRKFAKKQQK